MYSLGDNSRIGKQKLLVSGSNYTAHGVRNNKKDIIYGNKILNKLTKNTTNMISHNLLNSLRSDHNNTSNNLSSDFQTQSTVNLIDKNQIIKQRSKNDNVGAKYVKPTRGATKPVSIDYIEHDPLKFNKTHDIKFNMSYNRPGMPIITGNIGYAQRPSKILIALNEININSTSESRRRRMDNSSGIFNTSLFTLEATEENSDNENVNSRPNQRLLIMCPFLLLFGIATPLGKDKLFVNWELNYPLRYFIL